MIQFKNKLTNKIKLTQIFTFNQMKNQDYKKKNKKVTQMINKKAFEL